MLATPVEACRIYNMAEIVDPKLEGEYAVNEIGLTRQRKLRVVGGVAIGLGIVSEAGGFLGAGVVSHVLGAIELAGGGALMYLSTRFGNEFEQRASDIVQLSPYESQFEI